MSNLCILRRLLAHRTLHGQFVKPSPCEKIFSPVAKNAPRLVAR